MTVRIVSDETSQEIYEALLKRSKRSFDKYNRQRTLPRFKVPGELVFFLDDLLERHAAEVGLNPGEALAEVVDLGIVAWYTGLGDKAEKRWGLPKIATADAETEKIRKKLKGLSAVKDGLEEEIVRERDRRSEETGVLSEENRKLRARVEELEKIAEEDRRGPAIKPKPVKPAAESSTLQAPEDKPPKEHPKCSFPGCNKNRFVRGHGFCGKHWKQWKAGKIKEAKRSADGREDGPRS